MTTRSGVGRPGRAAPRRRGEHRREQGIPDHLILTEYHLLRQAIWNYLSTRFEASDQITEEIMRIDTAISTVTNASMWGYFRPEVEAQAKWEEAFERLVESSPLLRERGVH